MTKVAFYPLVVTPLSVVLRPSKAIHPFATPRPPRLPSFRDLKSGPELQTSNSIRRSKSVGLLPLMIGPVPQVNDLVPTDFAAAGGEGLGRL